MLATAVKFTLGSDWAPVLAVQDVFTASASSTIATVATVTAGDEDRGGADIQAATSLATATMTPPAAPEVFTAFLLGTKDFGYTLMPQIDAPEYGPCRPMLD